MTILLTSIILSILSFAIGKWLGKKNPARSSTFTAGSIILLLLLPLTLLAPKYEVSLPSSVSTISSSVPVATSFFSIFFWIWLTGSTFLLIRLLVHYLAVRSWRKSAERCSSPEWTSRLHECCSILNMDTIPSIGLSKHIQSPVVTGLVYPQILLPAQSNSWSEQTIKHVILHELGHVKRRDLWIAVASQITCAIHWFNPLVWLLKQQQHTQCEFACDTFVLSSGANAKNYIHAICDVAETASTQRDIGLALAMADKASLKKRVDILLQPETKKSATLAGIAFILTASIGLAANIVKPLEVKPQHVEQQDIINQEVETRFNANPFPADE